MVAQQLNGTNGNGQHPPADSPKGEYEDFAQRLSGQAKAARVEWLASMPPEELQRIRELGLDHDLSDYEIESNRGDEDAATWDEASFTTEFLDNLPNKLRELFNLTADQAQMIARFYLMGLERKAASYRAFLLQRVIAGFMRPGNVKLRAYGLAFAADLAALNGLGTMTEAGRSIGLSRASISKVANEWTDLLELPRSEHMKSQESRGVYSAAQKKKHWRHQKFEAPEPKPK